MKHSPEPSKQHSVFISYSRQDAAIAGRVWDALEAKVIDAWFDQNDIEPGHPDFDEVVRNAIKQSQALILLASPNSRQSGYVRGELEVARTYQRPVYPLWIVGDVWIEAIPLGLSSTQHIDARGANEQAGIHALIHELTALLRPKKRTPKRSGRTLQALAREEAVENELAIPVGTLLATLRGHSSDVRAVVWSPDGQRLASASQDKTVRLWDAATGEALATLRGHASDVQSVAWSPDGQRLASASHDQTVRLWDATSGEMLAILKGHISDVWAVAWSPDRRRLASASGDHTVRIWKV